MLKDQGNLEISVEINTAYEGHNGNVAGFFARDEETGLIYLLHSGRVGGGTRGVGKSAFLSWCDQKLFCAADKGKNIREGVIVMPVEGATAARSAARYIDSISRFKRAVRDGAIKTAAFQAKKKIFEGFRAEARGGRTGRRSDEIDYISNHGLVVDALHLWRSEKLLPIDGEIVNTALLDMGVVRNNELVEVFEVKTSAGRSDIYSAIGQLMVHGTAPDCTRVMVLPGNEPIAHDLQAALDRLKVVLVRFQFKGDEAIIVDKDE